jgi:hypothetical protein
MSLYYRVRILEWHILHMQGFKGCLILFRNMKDIVSFFLRMLEWAKANCFALNWNKKCFAYKYDKH